LQAGVNYITVLVHRDGCSASAPISRIMAHDPGFAALIEFTTNGATTTIGTDSTWLSALDNSFRARSYAWCSIPEVVNATLVPLQYNSPAPTTTALAKSVLVTGPTAGSPAFMTVWPRTIPLQLETVQTWSSTTAQLPVALSGGQSMSFKLPKTIQGYHYIVISAATAGSTVNVGYTMPDGSSTGQSSYTASAGAQVWMGGDTFGFNTLTVVVASGSVTFSQVQAFSVGYPFTLAASFQSSDAYLNQLWKICAQSALLLSEDAYVDCADRERAEWTDCSPPGYDVTRVMMSGPAASGSTSPAWGDARLLKNSLRRMYQTLQSSGQIKAHDCSDRFDVNAIMVDRNCDWVVQLRSYYDAAGDAAFVQECWPTLMTVMNTFMAARDTDGLVFGREWEVWDNPLRYFYCEGAGLNAFVYRALTDAAYLGNAAGESANAATLAADAAALATAYNSVLWSEPEGTYYAANITAGSYLEPGTAGGLAPSGLNYAAGPYPPTVQAALLALYSGIVPPGRVASVTNFIQANLGGVVEIMSYYFLYNFWYSQHTDHYDAQVLNSLRTAFVEFATDPSQTTWEFLNYSAGDSKCHVYGMHPGYYLTAYVLGARRSGPSSAGAIVIEPRCGGLSSAQGVAVTEFGPVPVSWTNNPNGTIALTCTVPVGVTSATLRLYARNDSQSILIDGAVTTGALGSDGFIEAQLSVGAHTIQYPATAPAATSVNLSGVANVYAIAALGSTPAGGGIGGSQTAFAANLLGGSLPGLGVTFTLGQAGVPNAVANATVNLPAGSYSSLQLLATAVDGNQPNQTFVVTYTDGSTASSTLSVSNCTTPQYYLGETIVSSQVYRIGPNGAAAYGTMYLFGYSLALNSAKTVKSIALPANANVLVLAMNLSPVPAAQSGLVFIPMPPYRVVDTRNPNGANGGPILGAGTMRNFVVPSAASGVPTSAQAYSLNVTVVPSGPLGALSVTPAGQTQPALPLIVSDGRIKAHAAIIGAGAGGAVTVGASDATHVIIDINGYFAPAGTASGLDFYPVPSTRLYDTRASGTGGPSMQGGSTRTFTIGGMQGIPASAKAYSLNFTAIPHAILGNITVWPTGGTQPNVSTLNAPTGTVTANAAIVPAGTSGQINVFTTDTIDLLIDVNGYFAPVGNGGLAFYPVVPTRVADSSFLGSGAAISGSLTVSVPGATSYVPTTAKAVVLNATVTPPTSFGHMNLWSDGTSQPTTSILNANDGAITSNLAIVPMVNGLTDVYLYSPTAMVLDVYGYFAP
jgi:hypothetical protein